MTLVARSQSSGDPRGSDVVHAGKGRRRRHLGGFVSLLLVALDDGRGTDLCGVWILAELAAGSPLPQQIPALIELDLDLFQTHLIVIGDRLLTV
jgi:hypothetical protein